jgi:hypothetical protein
MRAGHPVTEISTKARKSDAIRLFGKYKYKVKQIVSVDEMKQKIKRKVCQ